VATHVFRAKLNQQQLFAGTTGAIRGRAVTQPLQIVFGDALGLVGKRIFEGKQKRERKKLASRGASNRYAGALTFDTHWFDSATIFKHTLRILSINGSKFVDGAMEINIFPCSSLRRERRLMLGTLPSVVVSECHPREAAMERGQRLRSIEVHMDEMRK